MIELVMSGLSGIRVDVYGCIVAASPCRAAQANHFTRSMAAFFISESNEVIYA